MILSFEQRDSVSIDVEIKIMLPDRSVTILKIKRFSTADKVYEVMIIIIGWLFLICNLNIIYRL